MSLFTNIFLEAVAVITIHNLQVKVYWWQNEF